MRALCLSLIAVGAGLSLYLLFRHFAIVVSPSSIDAGVCSTVFGRGCDETLTHPLSILLGIPVAGWGVVYFGVLAALLALGRSIGNGYADETALVAVAVSLLGTLGSVLLAATFVVGAVPACPLCLVVHVVNLALFVALWRLAKCSRSRLAATIGAAASYLLGRPVEDARGARWKFVGYIAAGLVGVVLYQWVYVQKVIHPPAEEPPFDPIAGLEQHGMSPQYGIPVSAADPRIGPDDARARLVIFSDFQCPGCRLLASDIRRLVGLFGDGLQVVFKHFPLDSACNPVIEKDIHAGSCEMASLAVTAHGQDRFWALHDALFEADLDDQSLESVARAAGVDAGASSSGDDAPDVSAKVAEDIELGNALRISETPTLFLNGRRLQDIRPEAVQYLIATEIAIARDAQAGEHEHRER